MLLPLVLWMVATTIIFIIILSFNLYFLSNINSSYVLLLPEQKNIHNSSSIFYYGFSEFYLYLILFIAGVMIGWFLELKFKWIYNLNKKWQLNQPKFYKIIHPDFRSITPWFFLSGILLFGGIIYYLLVKDMFFVTFIIGYCIGLLIHPLVKLREMFLLDRPEKPPRAIIHKIIPKFPMDISVWVGQAYMRILLPLFSVFILSIIPLLVNDELFVTFFPTYRELPLIIIFNIFIGLALYWLMDKKNYVMVDKINETIVIKSACMLLMSIMLVSYGIFSENIFVLMLCSILAGVNLGSKVLYE